MKPAGIASVILFLASDAAQVVPPHHENFRVCTYRTFEELRQLMAEEVSTGEYDAVIHVAAVSGYEVAATYVTATGTRFEPLSCRWFGEEGGPRVIDASAGKVKSHHPELWLRLVPTPKLVDFVRSQWGFRGMLVKFKLEVGVTPDDLLEIAERSRRQSEADRIVANTFEGKDSWALLGPLEGEYRKIERDALASTLLAVVEHKRA